MALHLVFTDKQQIISKSQQQCAVRFLQEPTSISLQPACLSSSLLSSDCFAPRQSSVCVWVKVCACLRLISSDCLPLACLIVIELPSKKTSGSWRGRRILLSLNVKMKWELYANGDREAVLQPTHAHDTLKYSCSALVFEFPLWSLEWSAFTVAMLVKIPKKPSVDPKCYRGKRTRKRDHVFPILASIHWHPVISTFEFNWTLLLSLPFSYSLP